ncbi:MAG TPA: hypothetical protein VD905_18030 [Flavobacteriales bacterium]|nr:hypothetical protein [Flavobacteriales bacterium]
MKNAVLTFVICFLSWSVLATPGGATHKKVVDLGKGLAKVTWYFDNGIVAEEGFYLNGKKHGTWTSYNEKGQKKVIANWLSDKKDGSLYVLHENGLVKYEVVYSDNKKINAFEWDENGKQLVQNK